MTTDELTVYLEEWVREYCRNDFKYGIPAGVSVFIENAKTYLLGQSGVTSEKLGDYQITINPDFPPSMLKLLVPYRRLGVI